MLLNVDFHIRGTKEFLRKNYKEQYEQAYQDNTFFDFRPNTGMVSIPVSLDFFDMCYTNTSYNLDGQPTVAIHAIFVGDDKEKLILELILISEDM